MQFLVHTNIDFMRARRPMAAISAVLIVASLAYVFGFGSLNIGIDFVGGTQITLRFQERPEVDELRGVLAAAGLSEPRIQRFGAEGLNEVLIRTATVEGSEEGSSDALLEALDTRFNPSGAGGFDLNREGPEALTDMLVAADPERLQLNAMEASEQYGSVAEEILQLRRDQGLLRDWSGIETLPRVSPEVVSHLRANTFLGAYSLLSLENVGPQIGGELTRKGIWAVILSLLGMLAYIAYRFEFRFGFGAVAAILHDVIITLGLYAAGGFEFNLTTIAAFLTLVGYSVNDTVVVFDRVRENMRRSRREPLREVLNGSINQTLARTIMTSVTTLLMVTALFILGGEVIRGFAFILMIGVVVGTYSSVFVASPMVLVWERWLGRESRQPAAAS